MPLFDRIPFVLGCRPCMHLKNINIGSSSRQQTSDFLPMEKV
jgi:hypothetical protein